MQDVSIANKNPKKCLRNLLSSRLAFQPHCLGIYAVYSVIMKFV
jgi:hypothetical protein